MWVNLLSTMEEDICAGSYVFSVLSCLVVLIVYCQKAAHHNKVGVVNQGDEPPEAFNLDAEEIKKYDKIPLL